MCAMDPNFTLSVHVYAAHGHRADRQNKSTLPDFLIVSTGSMMLATTKLAWLYNMDRLVLTALSEQCSTDNQCQS